MRLQIYSFKVEDLAMTIGEMVAKNRNAAGNVATRSLKSVVAGGSADDFVSDGMLLKIIEESKQGFYDKRFGENAVFVIMERCAVDENSNIVGTGEAIQVNLSMFDRVAAPYVKIADNKVERDNKKETVRACGDTVDAWKRAPHAEAFMEDNQGKIFKATLLDTVSVRAWDRAAGKFSDSELRDQKVYKCEWAA